MRRNCVMQSSFAGSLAWTKNSSSKPRAVEKQDTACHEINLDDHTMKVTRGNIQTWSEILAHLDMNFSVVSLNPGTSSSLGHCELRMSQSDSFWSYVPVLGLSWA